MACPIQWDPLHAGPPAGDAFDGNVSVLVGGNLSARGSAAGAEGVVVVHGDASFARETPGPYEVGVTGTGSQVPPFADSDMLVVGGNLNGDPATHLDVGQSLGGDVAVGGGAAADVDLHGGRLDQGVPDVTAPYDNLLGGLGAKSAQYASQPVTGTVDVTDTAITLTGDGTADPQVFTIDGATLGANPDAGVTGRSLQLLGVPDGATVVVNLTGPAVDLDIDSLLAPDGTVIDPHADRAFANLATQLLWNAPGATTVDIGGQAQLPGSLLVPTAPSTTTLAGAGTNGRVLVAGDLVHTGSGALHSYPLLSDPDLACTGEVAHLGTLTIDVELDDPDKVVDPDRFYEGRFECRLNGVDVTPRDDTWQVRATADARVLSDEIPVDATCTVTERLQAPPASDWKWADPEFRPEKVKIAKRDPRGVVVVNRAVALPPPAAPPTLTSDPAPTLTSDPEPTQAPETDAPAPSEAPSTPTDPTTTPEPPSPTSQATPAPTPASTPSEESEAPQADAPNRGAGPGPLATTAPFTLRGAFVWGPLLMLSLLTMVLRTRKRPKRLH